MFQTIRAIYENGVFKPLDLPNLSEQEQVRLIVEPVAPEASSPGGNGHVDPLAGVRSPTGISDLAENFDDYRFGSKNP